MGKDTWFKKERESVAKYYEQFNLDSFLEGRLIASHMVGFKRGVEGLTEKLKSERIGAENLSG